MPLHAGMRLGPYEIIGPLGAGGMGEVYRARDPRLGRDVAVKALPASAHKDPDRIARFEREAKILAALNHPHIAAIYGIEEVPDATVPSGFLILELVEGGTLADRIARGPLPVQEVLTLARQVADALHAAHDKGIIHRDLKPGNIALTRDGQAKVLDFGLATPPTAGPDAATVAEHATESGVILGTFRYMSPEQARGLPLDKRSDIWSFGGVWFEALTGRHPFAADTASDTLAAILGRDPDWTQLPAGTPARVTWLLRRCLEKDPRRRLHDIADARIELDDAIVRPDASSGAIALGPATSGRWRERVAWTAAALGLVAAIGSYVLTRGDRPASPSADPQPLHASIVFPRDVRLSVAEDPASRFALSPDGRRLAVVVTEPNGESRLWVRPLDELNAQPLTGTEGAGYPFWSADSRSIGFIAGRASDRLASGQARLMRIDVASGQLRTVGNVSFNGTGTWNGDDVVLFTPANNSPIHRIAASGGTSSPVTTLDKTQGDVLHTRPFFLPDGRHFLYSVVGSRTGATDPRAVYVGSLDPNEPAKLLLDRGGNAKGANGHVIFVRDGRLMAQPFDATGMQLTPGTSPAILAEGVQEAAGATAAFSVSETGVIAYQAVAPVPMQLQWFNRDGKPGNRLGGVADYADVALSRDGVRAAVSMIDPAAGTRDIWVLDVKRGTRERMTSHPADDFAPVWSPTGDRLVFSSVRERFPELYEISSTGANAEAPLAVPGLDLGKFGAHWSPDGQSLILVAGGRIIARSDLWVLPMSGDRKPFAFAETSFVETQPRYSPDSRWVMYTSNEHGGLEVYIRPASGPGGRQRVSVNGGQHGLWGKDGAEVYFLSPENRIMSAAIRTEGPTFRVGDIRPLFPIQFRRHRLDGYPYAVSPDGQQFLVNTRIEEAAPPAISLLVNWPKLVQR